MPLSQDRQQPPEEEVDLALRTAVLEIEQHAAAAGWDQPARLFALVPTGELVLAEPALAEQLGLVEPDGEQTYTPVEQDPLPRGTSLEDALLTIGWPAEVAGCAAVVERLVLPRSADEAVPTDAAAAAEYAAAHPQRQEVRMVAAATRHGTTYCALRLRGHDEPADLLQGTELVPALLELLMGTLEQAGHDPTTHHLTPDEDE